MPERGAETLVPEFKIRIDGAELPVDAKADLLSVVVLEDIDAVGTCEFTVPSWDPERMKVKWVDHPLFKEGKRIEIQLGYFGRVETLFTGEITGLEPEFYSNQASTLTIRGHDGRHRMLRKRRTKSFLNVKDSDIAAQIASENGLAAGAEDSRVQHEYVLQHNQTDLEFLQERARRIGYETGIDGAKLLFRPRAIDAEAAATLRLSVELLEFRPRLSTLSQVEDLTVRGWDPKRKESVAETAKTGVETTKMDGSKTGPAVVQSEFSGSAATAVRAPVMTVNEAQSMSKGLFNEMALDHIVGDALAIGTADIRAGKLVKIEELGERFSGLYYVTSAEHSFVPQRGYRTAFTTRRNAT